MRLPFPTPILRNLLMGVLLAWSAAPLGAYTVTGSWPSGNRTYYVELDGRPETPTLPVGGLLDHAANWNAVARDAVDHWNAHMARTALVAQEDTTAPGKRNGRNEIAFASSIYGDPFGDRVLGTTLRSYASAPSKVRIGETDIFINTAAVWNSYRGALRQDSIDIRRVLIHELGHGVGLNHVDEGATATAAPAIMQTQVSDIDDLTADDIAAANILYANPVHLPTVTRDLQGIDTSVGGTATLNVETDGGPALVSTPTLRYSWLFTPNGEALEWLFNQTEGTLPLNPAQTYDSGTYTLRIETPDGTVESSPATVTVAPVAEDETTHLYNLSTRGFVDNGVDSLIMGFVVTGSTPRRILLRAAGPGLGAFGVPNALMDPVLELHDVSGNLLDTNDNWEDKPEANLDQVFKSAGAFAFASGSTDAALVALLSPGRYTAVVHANAATPSGVTLAEAYDLTAEVTGSSRLSNLSTRGHVYTDFGKMIGGLAVRGTGPRTYLIRAAGATLKLFSITNPLDDPTLTVFDESGKELRYTNDWDNPLFLQPTLTQVTSQVGGFPLGDRTESVLLLTLPPGNYSFHVAGGHGEDGISLFEVYEVPYAASSGASAVPR